MTETTQPNRPRKRRDGRNQLVSAYEERLFERAQLATLTTRCLFCGESFEGSAVDGQAWASAHRKAAHPGAVDRGQRARVEAAKGAPKVIAARGFGSAA